MEIGTSKGATQTCYQTHQFLGVPVCPRIWVSLFFPPNLGVPVFSVFSTGNTRQQFFDYVDQEVQLLLDAGHTVNVSTLVWIQGTADAGTLGNAQMYDERLQVLVNDLRDYYNSPSMLMKFSQAYVNMDTPFVTELRQSQEDYLELDRLAYLVKIDDQTLKTDNIHYTSSAVRKGQRYERGHPNMLPKP